MTVPTPPAVSDAIREAVDARALASELTTYANQLVRMETAAGFAGPDTSVRVKDPQWLAQLMRRAASALQVRRAEAAEAETARLRAALADVEGKCELARSVYATEETATPSRAAEAFAIVRNVARAALSSQEKTDA